MSWYSKVVWSEGLFLRPHHLQQGDRYLEHLLASRTRDITPYPWGFTHLEVDQDLAQQDKFGLRRAVGLLSDGTPFDVPTDSPLPEPIEIPENAVHHTIWLMMPLQASNTREVDSKDAETGSRYTTGTEVLIDSTSRIRVEEEIDVAFPRLWFEIRKSPKPGHLCLPIVKIAEIRDKTVVFDERFAPPVLICSAHPTVQGWIERVIGWIETRLEELARYAADPTSGGGLQNADYFMLQLLNRQIPALKHFQNSHYVHPERLYEELLRLSGELATFATQDRRAREYPHYDHDDLDNCFSPLLRDIQDFLSTGYKHRAIRLEIVDIGHSAFKSPIRDRNLFRDATFVLEVSADLPLTDIQTQFPSLFKVGPNTRMEQIVHAHLPGIKLVHMPTPPPQIRAISDHVYFYFDRADAKELWPEFSSAASIGMHFSGDWPGMKLDLWAIRENRQ